MGYLLQLNLILFTSLYNAGGFQWQQYLVVCVIHPTWVVTLGFGSAYKVNQDSSIGFSIYQLNYWSYTF